MTEEEERVLEKWKRRAKQFSRAYHEAEMEALDLKVRLDFKILTLQQRIAELEEKLKLTTEGNRGVFGKGGGAV